MSYLICIDFKNKQILHPEVMKLVDSFEHLTHQEMLYVALFADYSSVYKQFPEHERRRKAMWYAFNENEEELISSQKIKIAVEDYISLQYNPKIELINRYQKKIDKLLDLLDADDSPTAIEKITKAINSLRDNIRNLQYEVDEQVRLEGQIKGDRQLSYIEKMIANKKQYESVVAKR